jgi:transcription-repair coupling factor (superfamily II helicase)
LFVTASEEKAATYFSDIKLFVENTQLFPYLDENQLPDSIASVERIQALKNLGTKKSITVCPLKSAMQKIPKPAQLPKTLNLLPKEEYDLNIIAKILIEMGYSREYLVEVVGQFSIRGNILDIYVPTASHPYRVDFYGDTIDNIRSFDITSQKSLDKITSAHILPVAVPEESKHSVGLFNYFDKNTLVILDERSVLKQKSNEIYESEHEETYLSPQQFFGFKQKEIDLLSLISEDIQFYFNFSPPKTIAGQFEKNKKTLTEYHKKGDAVVVCLDEKGRQERMAEILESWNIESTPLNPGNAILPASFWTAAANLSSGFYYETAKLCVLCDSDIFIKKFRQVPTALRNAGEPLTSFTDLQVGDYLVHITHGIAKYGGLVIKKFNNFEKEYLLLEYASNDKLMVPVTQLDRVSKYIGTGKEPKISRLGGTAWLKTKRKVKESVRQLALELLDLYTDRATVKGYLFSNDTVWQHELEEDFPFEETPGQISAIDQIKKDMESPKPMDRLIAGDVGYGKTEVALRAAFKAIMDSKQVMLLAPTTILALQHFNTLKNRFSPFPINIGMLSRFISKKNQQDIINRFNNGKIDIIVGTHRLLQKDIKPKNLGLIIIDEEQRFGVKQKENLRALRKNTDILTMTATPIPRTLQMALSGIRDLSIIETAPENRQPISTHVGPLNENMIKEAVTREIDRGGQVFYLHNDIKSLPAIVNRLKELVPDVRVKLAHGQMTDKTLEKTMVDFLDKKFDVLVTTTIIEAGLDIPSVNTLIVTDAENFGLSQLYQIRGRIGRSEIKSYAYLFYGKKLTNHAVERLKTLAQYTALGSGFKIAMKDLELRGAGNLLGAEQSGQIDAVGFDLYINLLKEAVAEIQGSEIIKPIKEKELRKSAYLPSYYVEDEASRIDFYHRIALADNKSQLNKIAKELVDRFGKMPEPANNLISQRKINL